jgi:hypothetical protein
MSKLTLPSLTAAGKSSASLAMFAAVPSNVSNFGLSMGVINN